MAQEDLIKFIIAVETDETLNSELVAARTPEEKAAAAVRHGHLVTTQDLKELAALAYQFSNGELSDADLETVAGGTLDGINRLIAVTQMKSANANDEALRSAPEVRARRSKSWKAFG